MQSQLVWVVAAFVAATTAASLRSGAVRRTLVTIWTYGRHTIPMVLASLRWPSIAASSGIGKWVSVPRGHGETAHTVQRPANVPVTKSWRLTPAGYEFVARHSFGQSVETLRTAIPELKSGLRGDVRVLRCYDKRGSLRHDRSRVVVNRRNPFDRIREPHAESPTRLVVGVLEDGRPWVKDYRQQPHGLDVGETGSGKSGLESTIIRCLAPMQGVALCLVDLKAGVSAAPAKPRASVVAETPEAAGALLEQLLEIGFSRAAVCKIHGVDKVYDLPKPIRAGLPEIYLVIDEVAELTYGDRSEANKRMDDLLRVVSLVRFAGIHVEVMGQRFGSTLHKNITSVRAQLPGRVCLRIGDHETGQMVMGDVAPEAVRAALDIPEDRQGMAVIKGGPDRWLIGRAAYTSHADLADVCRTHADKRIAWDEVLAETVLPPTDVVEDAPPEAPAA